MIRFVICEDNTDCMTRAYNTITKAMMPYDIEYKTEKYSEYCLELKKTIRKNTDTKIYILDIELPIVSGLEIASEIREHDWNSTIIFVTAHPECKNDIFHSRLLALDFISKFATYEKRLYETINCALKQMDKKKMLSFTFGKASYRIPYDEILYIEKVPLNKKCLIKTESGQEYQTTYTIDQLMKLLGPSFYKSHKSAIVNVEKVRKVDCAQNLVTFKNNTQMNVVSDRCKKGLKEYAKHY